MFPRAIEDLPLALLGTAVLIAAGDPAGLLIPSILSRDAVAESLILLILGNFCRRFSIHDRRKIKGEMHGGRIVHRHAPPKRLISLVGCGKSRRVILRQV